MSPRQRDRWVDFDRPYAPRVAVEGGVRVARPGQVHGPDALELVRLAAGRTTSGVNSRARTYARAGQVVELRLSRSPVTASAAIQGSGAAPYAVSLTRDRDGDLDADCSCPYGCDSHDWCKHAAALAYVLADLVDRDPEVATLWDGRAAPSDTAPSDTAPSGAGEVPVASQEVAGLIEALLGPPPIVDAAAQWAAAFDVLPPPR